MGWKAAARFVGFSYDPVQALDCMILRTAGGKAKNEIISCHARRQRGAIEGYLAPHSTSKSASAFSASVSSVA